MSNTVKLSSASDRSQADRRMEVIGNWVMCRQQTWERDRDLQAPTRETRVKPKTAILNANILGNGVRNVAVFMKSRVQSGLVPTSICVHREYA